ncbi:MAG: lysophospholipid acyltransferase family protein [Candidatus Izemoplasmataceae bacterium]
MLSIFLVFVQLFSISVFIYVFDYQVDDKVNQIGIILLGILVGLIVMLLVLYLYIEVFYQLLGKKKPMTSMVKHKMATQMVSIPLHLTHTKITIVGKEHLPSNPGFTIYSNHTSLMDIPLYMYGFYDYPVAFLAKEKVKNIFAIGKWVEALGGVMIDRENTRKGAEAIIKVIKHVKMGLTMVIFPEGTRSKDPKKLLPFKDGSFKVALKSKAPLVPMTIVKKEKVSWPRKKEVTIIIHEAIPYEEMKDLKSQELSAKVEEVIKSAL